MNPICIKSKFLNEEYFLMHHPSGLDIYVYPKRGYSSNYAIFGTKFGSINNKFKLKNQSSFTVVPDGIAHYLEHKLFAGEKGDAFELFSKTGADANAYTSFEKTAYLFSCTDNLKDSLNILLDFVQSPYFTDENVQKERGIIEQEIKMYQDSPEWKMLINLLDALYFNHPVKTDIAGSVESISKITPQILYECYNTFYNLHNMALCVVGNVETSEIFEIVDKKLTYSKPLEVERFFPNEPKEIRKASVSECFDIISPLMNLGFKENIEPGRELSTQELVYTDIILKCLASDSSPLYRELWDNKLINASFCYEYFNGPGYASVIFSGETKNPEKIKETIFKHIKKIHNEGISLQDFQRAKKAVYGQSLSAFNSVSSIANLVLDFAFSGKEIFDYMEKLSKTTLDGALKRLESQLDCNYSALSVAEPKQ